MDELRNYLNTLEPGPVEETTHLERLLAEVWDDLGGDNGGMAGIKLIRRMERVEWHRPILTFLIERHGGTVLGSTRAELQRWSVHLDRGTATCVRTGHRQLARWRDESMSCPSPMTSPARSLTAKRTTGFAGSEMGVSGWSWAGSSPKGRDTSRPSRVGD